MSIPLNITALEEVPENARKFVTENDGKFFLDNEGIMKGLLAERANSDTLKGELSAFKAAGMSVDEIKAFAALKKSPAEISELLAASAKPQPSASGITEVQLLEMQKELAAVKALREELAAAQAKNKQNTRNELARKLVASMDDDIDKERAQAFVERYLLDKFTLNEQDELDAIDGKLPGDWLRDELLLNKLVKSSTAGGAKPGNTNIPTAGSREAAFAAAKEKGDYTQMVANSKVIE